MGLHTLFVLGVWCKCVENRCEIDRWLASFHRFNMSERSLSHSPTTAESLHSLGEVSSEPPPVQPTGPADKNSDLKAWAALRSAGQYEFEDQWLAAQNFQLDELTPCKSEVMPTLTRNLSDAGGNPANPLQ